MFVQSQLGEVLSTAMNQVRPTTFKVLYAVAMRSRVIQGRFKTFVGYATLKRDTGIHSDTTISHAFKELTDRNIIKRQSRGYNKSFWTIFSITPTQTGNQSANTPTSSFVGPPLQKMESNNKEKYRRTDKPKENRYSPRVKATPEVMELVENSFLQPILSRSGIKTASQLQFAVNNAQSSPELFVCKVVETDKKNGIHNVIGACVNGLRQRHLPAEWSIEFVRDKVKRFRDGEEPKEITLQNAKPEKDHDQRYWKEVLEKRFGKKESTVTVPTDPTPTVSFDWQKKLNGLKFYQK